MSGAQRPVRHPMSVSDWVAHGAGVTGLRPCLSLACKGYGIPYYVPEVWRYQTSGVK